MIVDILFILLLRYKKYKGIACKLEKKSLENTNRVIKLKIHKTKLLVEFLALTGRVVTMCNTNPLLTLGILRLQHY